MSDSEQNTEQQVLRYEYVLGALSDIGDELCRVTSFDAQLKSLLHLLMGTLGVRKGGIFLFDTLNKKISLRCSWKLALKKLDYNLTSEEMTRLDEDSEELTYRLADFKHLTKVLDSFSSDNLDSVSVLRVRGKLIGLIVIGHKLKETPLTDKELTFFIRLHK